MQHFKKRTIQRQKTLGERLKKVREESDTTLEEASAALKIRTDYLLALEQGNYQNLPGSVYIENYLQRYAAYLNVSSEFVLNLYREQESRVVSQPEASRLFAPKRIRDRAWVTPKMIRSILIGLVILAFLSYVGYEVYNIFSPPELLVDTPRDYATVEERTITLRGTTDTAATLTINGEPVILQPDGTFSTDIDLTEGMNTITLESKKKRSAPTIVQRHVLLEIYTE